MIDCKDFFHFLAKSGIFCRFLVESIFGTGLHQNMTPSQNKHDPYTNMVSYESTRSGDHNMSICRQAQKTYSGHFFAKSGPSQNFYPRDYLFSRSFRREKKVGGGMI